MRHSIPSAGLRLELPGGVIAYTCDTEPTPAIVELGRQARLLITECTYLRKNEKYARMARHMTAFEAGQQAAACEAGTLALVHLGEARATGRKRRRAPRRQRPSLGRSSCHRMATHWSYD